MATATINVGAIIESGKTYAAKWKLSNAKMSSPSENTIIFDAFIPDLGQLVSGPGVPLNMDFLQDNLVLDLLKITLNKIDAGYDPDGPFGPGTYVLGDNFETAQRSHFPPISIRNDNWNQIIGYFFEPSFDNENFTVRVIGRLDAPSPLGCGSSYWATQLQKAAPMDGMFVFDAIVPCDSMGVIQDGEFVMLNQPTITLIYGDVEDYYPVILIQPIG